MKNNPKIEPNIGPPPSSGHSLLPEWGLIFVEGSDAAGFLQNQLTNSVLGLKRSKYGEIAEGAAARLIGYCNPKGRLLASAWLALYPANDHGEDRFALFISRDIASSIAKRLSMYVLRSKVKVTDVSDSWKISGFYGSQLELDSTLLEHESLALRVPDVLYSNQSIARILIAESAKLTDSTNALALANWNTLEVLSAIPRIVLATQEQFVPQMINFESVAGVDFKKGCYPGQEIVARSQYRGAIKRRLQLASLVIDQSNLVAFGPGVELFHSNDLSQPAGMVVLSAVDPNVAQKVNLQIECKLEALESGEIHIGSATGPVLKKGLLPYSLLEI